MYLVKGNEVDEEAFKERIDDALYNQNYGQGNATVKADDINLLMVLIDELTNDIDDEDGIVSVKTKTGTEVSVQGGIVSATPAEGPADNDANINIVFDMAMVAKATDDDDSVFIAGELDEREMAVMIYAAELAGLNVENRPEDFQVPEDLKTKMDTLWAQKQEEMGLAEPAADVAADLSTDADATVTADLGIMNPTMT